MNGVSSTQKVVINPKTEELITLFTKADPTTGEELTYGRVRVDESAWVMQGGFQKEVNRTAFITIDAKILTKFAPLVKEGKPYPIPGKIVILETFSPQWDNHVPKINPSTDEYVKVNGENVYRSSNFTTDMNEQDTFLRNVAGQPVPTNDDADNAES